MRVSSRGQITIPAKLRRACGLAPGAEVDFWLEGYTVKIVPRMSRGERLIARLRGTGDGKMTTDQILTLTRGRKPRL